MYSIGEDWSREGEGVRGCQSDGVCALDWQLRQQRHLTGAYVDIGPDFFGKCDKPGRP
jgi:hypothetical protein